MTPTHIPPAMRGEGVPEWITEVEYLEGMEEPEFVLHQGIWRDNTPTRVVGPVTEFDIINARKNGWRYASRATWQRTEWAIDIRQLGTETWERNICGDGIPLAHDTLSAAISWADHISSDYEKRFIKQVITETVVPPTEITAARDGGSQ